MAGAAKKKRSPFGTFCNALGTAVIVIVIAAKCIGSMLPLIAKKIGIDPALMASPMIASLTDMVSVTSYFMMATMILHV